MTIDIVSADAGLITCRVSARLTENELRRLQAAAVEEIRRHGSLRILVIASDFQGWEEGGLWNDFSFQEHHDRDIRRMAIVGDEKWRDEALLFTSEGMRSFPIEYFPTERLAEAKAWVMA